MSGDNSESHYKTMEVIIVQSIIKSVLDSIEAISERPLVTLPSMSDDDSESHYKTMEVIIVTIKSVLEELTSGNSVILDVRVTIVNLINKTMEVIIVQSIIKSVLDSIEAISERPLVTLPSLMSGDNSESHYKTMEVIIVQSIVLLSRCWIQLKLSQKDLATLSSLMSGDNSESHYKTMEVIIVTVHY